jgi:hypothetical protein
MANVGSREAAALAAAGGAAGIDLFRMEFLFMSGATPPGEDEQAEVYEEAGRVMAPDFLAGGGPPPDPALYLPQLRAKRAPCQRAVGSFADGSHQPTPAFRAPIAGCQLKALREHRQQHPKLRPTKSSQAPSPRFVFTSLPRSALSESGGCVPPRACPRL